MININKLKGKIIEKGFSIGLLADQLGIDKSTLYRKLSKNGESISIAEANKIAEILELDAKEIISIFFDQTVAFMRRQKGA